MAIDAGEQIICVVPPKRIVFAVLSSSCISISVAPVVLKIYGQIVLEALIGDAGNI